MSRIQQAFAGHKALIPFITCGDPDLETTEELVLRLAEAGADLIELGIPFSDPTAEGPVIMAASERALNAGTTTDKIFARVKRLRQTAEIPLVFMTYAKVVDLISMVAPTSDKRIAMIAREAKGFLYIVSSLGVTGVRSAISTDIRPITEVIRSVTDIPCAVGFGISSPEQAASMAELSDGAIVGSAIVKLIAKHGKDCQPAVEFVRSLAESVHAVS